MLTELLVRNFKTFDETRIELGNPVVFVGPNNSGKSTALQALALWQLGLKRWLEKRGEGDTPAKRPGVTINRRDLTAVPVPSAKMLWRDLNVRRQETSDAGAKSTANVRIDIVVRGVGRDRQWECGFEFDYANEESLYCRPLRLADGGKAERMTVPPEASDVRVAFLPPMSGLDAREFRKDAGEIETLIGEGRTAEVLRNLCYRLTQDGASPAWLSVRDRLRELFGVDVLEPEYISERSELTMRYTDQRGVKLDLACAGRGLQQVLLLLSYLQVNPRSVLLLDEPDAHLEILRQRQIYNALVDSAEATGSQIVAASHSEVLLNEAADRHTVMAFVGEPHRMDDRGSQVLKALKDIGFEQYYQAELTGWVLYLEGPTDLAILRRFATRLNHPAGEALSSVFAHFVANQPGKATEHFYALREAKPDLVGLAVYDRLDRELDSRPGLKHHCWMRNEIENYLCQPETLLAFAADAGMAQAGGPLLAEGEAQAHKDVMQVCIRDLVPPIALRDPQDSWWTDEKASDRFLNKLFQEFYRRLELPNLMAKTDYHKLVQYVPAGQIDPEITRVLDQIVEVADQAKPRG